MSQAIELLERFLTLTRAINLAAEAQEWDETERLGLQRAAQLGDLPADLAARVDPEKVAHVRALIEECLQLDARTRALAEERQQTIRVLLREP